MEVEINIEEIQEFLPHRYPMLLVDRVTEIILGDRIVAYKNITTKILLLLFRTIISMSNKSTSSFKYFFLGFI